MQHPPKAGITELVKATLPESPPTSGYTVETDRVEEPVWTEILREFDDATLYQNWGYGSTHWSTDQLSHLVLRENGGIVAAAQLRIVTVPFINRGIAYLPWGPLWRRRDRRRLNHLTEVLTALHEEYVLRRRLLLRIQTGEVDQAPEASAVRQIFESVGYKLDPSYQARRTFLLDLEPSLTELKGAFARRWRRGLDKALRNNLEVKVGNSPAHIQELLQLYREMLARKRFIPGINADELGLVQDKLQEPEKMQVFIAYSDGVPSAGTAISCIGEKAVPILAATGESGLRTRASYLVQWKAIEWLKTRGAVCYDLGGIDPVNNPGVYQFKKGLSGVEVSHLGRFEASTSRISACISASRLGSTLHRVAARLSS